MCPLPPVIRTPGHQQTSWPCHFNQAPFLFFVNVHLPDCPAPAGAPPQSPFKRPRHFQSEWIQSRLGSSLLLQLLLHKVYPYHFDWCPALFICDTGTYMPGPVQGSGGSRQADTQALPQGVPGRAAGRARVCAMRDRMKWLQCLEVGTGVNQKECRGILGRRKRENKGLLVWLSRGLGSEEAGWWQRFPNFPKLWNPQGAC